MISLLRRVFAPMPDERTSQPLTWPVMLDGIAVANFLRETGYRADERWPKRREQPTGGYTL